MFPTPEHTATCAIRLRPASDAGAAFAALRGDAFPWLLDSALRGGPRGRFSFAGSDPYLVARAFGVRVDLDCRRSVRAGLDPGRVSVEHDPLDVVRSLLPRAPSPDGDARELPFVGGAVGYLGYELGARAQCVVTHTRDDLGLADMVLLFVDRHLAFDHATGRAWALGTGFGRGADAARSAAERAAGELAGRVAASDAEGFEPAPRATDVDQCRALLDVAPPEAIQAFFDQDTYAKTVDELLDEIAAGNVYQANLTHRMDLPYGGDAWTLYRTLRRVNPAPFAAFIDLPEAAILCSSPERFLRLDEAGGVESRPIKGTRPRGATPREDRALARALASSLKDAAENLMIVDLVRNDLGRVCEIGSVAVPQLMQVETYASVFQLVSAVTGRLRADRDALDLVRASFPPGSMTGAPKIAAMRLLDRLEPVRRGVYSGAIGYFDGRGGLDLSVVIRTLVAKEGRVHVHAGGGVVADSDPVAEYRETLDKAKALIAAVVLASGGRPDR